MNSDYRIAKIYQQNAGVDNSYKTLNCFYGNTLIPNMDNEGAIFLWCYCCDEKVNLGTASLETMKSVIEKEDWKEIELT